MNDESGPVVESRCDTCGKQVRGFPGDYGRCCCGHFQRLPAQPPNGWRLVRGAERLKVLPFAFVLLFFASVVAIAWTGGGTGLAGGTVVVIVFAAWIFAIMQFSRAAERQKGWLIPVIEYHAASLGVIPCFYVIFPTCNAVAQGDFKPLASLTFFVAVAGSLVCLLIYGDARRRVAHLRFVRDL